MNPSRPNPKAAKSTSGRAALAPGSSPRPIAPSPDRPASTTRTAMTMKSPAAVATVRPR